MDLNDTVPIPQQISLIEAQIESHQSALSSLQTQLAQLESKLCAVPSESPPPKTSPPFPLLPAEYKRYGRQLIMPEVGLPGQLALKNASVLIVGAGGLGCPAAAYLAGAGVGHITIVDGDIIEESNLQRQILYGGKVGRNKAESLVEVLNGINPLIRTTAHPFHLTTQNAVSLISQHSLVLDCTDSPASRYLVSDASVLSQTPLVSASALRTDGQLMTLNHPARPAGYTVADGGGGAAPCYRCVFPRPPPPESVMSCADGGVLGPVVGVMGVLQALEAIRVITTGASTLSSRWQQGGQQQKQGQGKEQGVKMSAPSIPPPTMLLFSATSSPPFRTIRLRPSRRVDCAVCSSSAHITAKSFADGSMDYVQFCGGRPIGAAPLPAEQRVSAQVLADALKGPDGALLLDVRDETQFELCNLAGSINVPWRDMAGAGNDGEVREKVKRVLGQGDDLKRGKKAFVVCRLGNDSQDAVRRLKQWGFTEDGWDVRDLVGGLKAWTEEVDASFPEY